MTIARLEVRALGCSAAALLLAGCGGPTPEPAPDAASRVERPPIVATLSDPDARQSAAVTRAPADGPGFVASAAVEPREPAAAPPAGPAPSRPGDLRRVAHDAPEAGTADPKKYLPPATAEVPRAWIGWHLDRASDAFVLAIFNRKPLVLIMAEDTCEWCRPLVLNTLRCAEVNRFAGLAVFAYSRLKIDEGARSIADALDVPTVPTWTILEPNPDGLEERGRMKGFFEAGETGSFLQRLLAPAFPPTVNQALYLMAQRKLTHVPPPPDCK